MPTRKELKEERFPRYQNIHNDYVDGGTLRSVGKKYGLSCERIRLIVKKVKSRAYCAT